MDDLRFACEAALEAEKLVGLSFATAARDAPNRHAQKMAEVMMSATVLFKMKMSLELPNGFGDSVRNVLEQLEKQWKPGDSLETDLNIGHVTIPDGPFDYVNLAQPHLADEQETMQ
jgi:hypothetical protein